MSSTIHIAVSKTVMVRIISVCIRVRIHLDGLISDSIRVRIFSIRHRIQIPILNSVFYDVNIYLYFIRQFDSERIRFESEMKN